MLHAKIDPALANLWPSVDVFGPDHNFERVMEQKGILSLKRWERPKLTKYIDVVDKNGKIWYAIGVGHGGASGVWPSQEEIANSDLVLTMDQALRIFADDLALEYEPGVNRLIKSNITSFMYSSMVHCAFNLGITRFAQTAMVKHLNTISEKTGEVKYIAACASLQLYNRARNEKTRLLEVRNGLTCRRQCEGELFLTVKEESNV